MTTRKAPGSKRSRGALRIWTLEGQRRFPGKKFAGESPPSSLMANKEVEFHEAASEEFEAAFDWYWERSAGAGRVKARGGGLHREVLRPQKARPQDDRHPAVAGKEDAG